LEFVTKIVKRSWSW